MPDLQTQASQTEPVGHPVLLLWMDLALAQVDGN